MMQKITVRWCLALSALSLTVPALAEVPVAPARASAEGHFIALDGAQNFRDVGGYRTREGRIVKHGVMYRAGTLGRLTPAGQARFESLRTAAVIDLRSTDERSRDGNAAWLRARPGYWARDYGISMGDLARAFGNPSQLTAVRVRALMTDAYRTMWKEQAPSYRMLFSRLLDSKGPLVLNCTAGKDRTGIGTALVLTTLGVPYETVRRDFLLSNAGVNPALLQGEISSPFAALAPDVAAPLLGVEGGYLDAAFESIRREYGSVEAFMAKDLGVGPREVARLRRRMLS
jgi:protein-tyrosine phosphatase